MSYSNRAYIHSYCSLSIHYYNNFYFRSFFSLSSPFAQPTPSSSASSSEAHTPTDKIKNQPQNQQQNHPETPQNQTHPHMDTLTETERVDRRLWQIGVLGSECLDQRSSHHAWIRDRKSGSACLDRSAWIDVLLAMLGSEIERVDWRLRRISVLGSALFSSCSLLGSKFQKVWNREEWKCWNRE